MLTRLSATANAFKQRWGLKHYINKNDNTQADVVSMDKGKFSVLNDDIGYIKFNKWICEQIQANKTDLAFVTNTPANKYQLLWFDIDNLSTSLEELRTAIVEQLSTKYKKTNKQIMDNMIITQSESNECNFHIYVVSIFVNRNERKKISANINNALNTKCIDLSAQNLRFDGTRKYVRGKFINRRYLIKYPENMNWRQFYNKVQLLKYPEKQGWINTNIKKISFTNTANKNKNKNSTLSDISNDTSSASSTSTTIPLSSESESIPSTMTIEDLDFSDSATNNSTNSNPQQLQKTYLKFPSEFNDSDDENSNTNNKQLNTFSRRDDEKLSKKATEYLQSLQKKQHLGIDVSNSIKKCIHKIMCYKITNVNHNRGLQTTKFDCDATVNCPFVRISQHIGDCHQTFILWNHVKEVLIMQCDHVVCAGKKKLIFKTNSQLTEEEALADCEDDDSEYTNQLNSEQEDIYIRKAAKHDQDLNLSDDDDIMSDLDIMFSDNENENADEKKETERELSSGEQENEKERSCIKSDQVREEVNIRYGFIKSVLQQYPISQIKKYSKTKSVLFACDKSEKARQCPFSNRTHSKNNVYLVYKPANGLLQLRCHHSGCEGKLKNIWTRKKSAQLPRGNDTDLAKLFMTKYTDIIWSDTDPNGKGFYIKTQNYWQFDAKNRIVSRRLQTEFAEYVDTLFIVAISECEEESKMNQMLKDRNDAEHLLKMSYKRKGMYYILNVL